MEIVRQVSQASLKSRRVHTPSLAVPHAPSRRPDRLRHVDRSSDDVRAANAPRDKINEVDERVEKESLAHLGDTIDIITIFCERRETRRNSRAHARRRYAVRNRCV